jgi:uncharacterized protein
MKVYIKRNLDLSPLLKRKSLFLFGPRQTGKTTFLEATYGQAAFYSLLKSDLFLQLNRDPSSFRKELEALEPNSLIIVDEIQKLPQLLDEVHYLIQKRHHRFVLTGSSARKLRRSGVNLLGGRASEIRFHPLNFAELGEVHFDLPRILNFGTLPSVFFSEAPESDLQDYVSLYLREEIQAEGLVRKLASFSRFLEVAALSNSKMINYTQIATDAQIAPSVCYEYFQILKDTLFGQELPAWGESKKRKAISTAKFYFFDCGVVRTAQGRGLIGRNDPLLGEALETYIFHELQTVTDYHRLAPLHYWRSKSQFEVDFIFNADTAIEVKATARPSARDLKGLRALAEEKLLKRYILVCQVPRPSKEGIVEILPVPIFLDQLWLSLPPNK